MTPWNVLSANDPRPHETSRNALRVAGVVAVLPAIAIVAVVVVVVPGGGGGGGGVLPKKMGRSVRPASQNPYPIYEQPAG